MGSELRLRDRWKFSRAIFSVHSWLGLSFCLLLTIIFLSGTLSVLRAEIDWLIYPQTRASAESGKAGFDRILAAVRHDYPDMGLLGQVPERGETSYTAVNLIGVSPTDGVRRIWVDPYRGVTQGTTPLMTPGYFLSQLHAYLMIPTWGYAIVCSFAFFLLASLVTGLLTYRKFWRGFFRRPRVRSLRTLMGDLHRLAGVWSIWFLAIMILTSFWYFWIRVGEPLLGFPQAIHEHAAPQMSDAEIDRLGPGKPAMLSLDALARIVRKAEPDFDIRYAELPPVHGGAVSFTGNTGEFFGRSASSIDVDPYRGHILDRSLVRDGITFIYAGSLANALHYGDFGGLASKFVWFFFGLATTGLSLSGIVIFWKRATRFAPPGQSNWPRKIWHAVRPWGGAMGYMKPVNLIVLALAAVATVATLRFYATAAQSGAASYSSREVGQWSLGALIISGLGDNSDPIKAGKQVMVLVQFCPDCWNDIKRLWVNVGPTQTGEGERRVSGQPGFAQASVTLPASIDANVRLWLVAESWDGRRHTTSWPLVSGRR